MIVTMLFTLIGLTLGILIVGVVSMSVGGKFNKKNSTRLMSARVVVQALAILFAAIASYYYQK